MLLFDIDGVIRDVSSSYRRCVQLTVSHFCKLSPSMNCIDNIKSEGKWNNDWDLSIELIRRFNEKKLINIPIPDRSHLIEVFNRYYFGQSKPSLNHEDWNGLIKKETLLINKEFFKEISLRDWTYGFVSGADRASAEYILKTKLGLKTINLIAMEDAPGKPDPKGLIKMVNQLQEKKYNSKETLVAYTGDTVSDILTVINAKERLSDKRLISFGIAPPHLWKDTKKKEREIYEKVLVKAGANEILQSLNEVFIKINQYK